jgi:hypothetical protein
MNGNECCERAVGRAWRGRRALIAGLALLAPAALGCKMVAAPFLMWGPEPTKPVAAEYPYLEGKRVCIVVWTDRDVQFEYPFVQLEVSEHLAIPLKANVRGIAITPNRDVVDFQRREPDWDRMPPAQIGQRFGAERVLMVELTLYTTREPESTHLYRGRISANVKVYDAAAPSAEAAYRTTVECAYPPDSHGAWGTDDRQIRKAMMEAFANDVAQKFYEHRVKLQ